jgi:hypothetical protein
LSCERLTIKEIQVESVKYVLLKEKTYDLVARVNNQDPNYGLVQFKYTFSIFDFDGALMLERAGTDFILPSENKYLIEANIETAKPLGKVTLKIEPSAKTDWQKLAENYESPNIYVHDRQLNLSGSQQVQSEVTGIIRNDSLFDFDRIIVTVVLFDEEKEIIGVNKTEARTILAGEDRYFSAVWFTPINGEVASSDVKAETNLFQDSNFMRRFGVQEKFQQY